MDKDTRHDTQLVDRFGRRVTYLRVSVTDRCDLRCVYCMAERMRFAPKSEILSLEEIIRIGAAFSGLGVNKIRVTGGEPLVRENILTVFEAFGRLDGVTDLTLTTNGARLARFAPALKRAGVTRVNISLDSLKPERFRRMTRVGDLANTLAGIEAALAQGFRRLKLNAVILKGDNDDECVDLVRFAVARGMDISFIEEMPLGAIDTHDRARAFVSSAEIRRLLSVEFELHPSAESTGGPARYYRVSGHDTRVGFISPHSRNFCASCNRVRLTAKGRLLLCLGQEHSVDLKPLARRGDMAGLQAAIVESMAIKPKGHDFNLSAPVTITRHMSATGG